MSSTGSVTRLLDQLKQGERDHAQELWERYFRRLVGLARQKLGTLPRHAGVDGEDVALSAFCQLFSWFGLVFGDGLFREKFVVDLDEIVWEAVRSQPGIALATSRRRSRRFQFGAATLTSRCCSAILPESSLPRHRSNFRWAGKRAMATICADVRSGPATAQGEMAASGTQP